jgi:hypothetical protein
MKTRRRDRRDREIKRDGIKRARNREKKLSKSVFRRGYRPFLNKKGIQNMVTSHSRLESKQRDKEGEIEQSI